MGNEIQLAPDGPEGRGRAAAPRARLEKGDGLVIDGVWHAYLDRSYWAAGMAAAFVIWIVTGIAGQAIIEQFLDFVFGGELNIQAELCPEIV